MWRTLIQFTAGARPRGSRRQSVAVSMLAAAPLLAVAALGVMSSAPFAAPANDEPLPGAKSFELRCAGCHGGDGDGTDRAPSLRPFVIANRDEQISDIVRNGVRAMPAHDIGAAELTDLIAFLRKLAPPGSVPNPNRQVSITLDSGEILQGEILNETSFNAELLDVDGHIHMLTRDADRYREPSVLPKTDWPYYDGSYTGNRHSPLDQINTDNVSRLQLRWMLPLVGVPRLEGTPVVLDGVMFVTAVNAAYALDATSGRRLWVYRRPRTPGLVGEPASGSNRGAAVSKDRVLIMTDNAHLLALDRGTGKLVWEVELTDWPKSQYGATAAPLLVGEHVIVGVGGGEEGARGFVASYAVATGARDWQFWTIPAPGEKAAATWVGNALEHGCGATWLSGSYDPQLDRLYWTVGNPCPDFNGAERKGDNLYTDSVLALEAKTGKLVWYYQFTPHDTHDWDAAEPLMLVDTDFEGKFRHLLVQADRNGFLFVLDRIDGKFLRATPFVTSVNWTGGFSKQGRAIVKPDIEPTPQGNLICPAQGTNWMSASFNPALGLVYVSAMDRCAIAKLIPGPFEMGKRYYNGTVSFAPGGTHSVRALELATGKTLWDYPLIGTGRSMGGTLSTAGGLVFFPEDNGTFTALDGKSGKPLWHFPANDAFRASPMTYMVGGKQYVTVASASGYLTFALRD